MSAITRCRGSIVTLYIPIALVTAASLASCLPVRFEDSGNETQANFVPTDMRGKETTTYKSPNGVTERCIISRNFPGVDYDKDDPKDEERLCNLDFYKTKQDAQPPEAVALCPKMSSTFPGIEVYELGTSDKKTYEEQLCRNQNNRPTKRIAKYKQSISCSYTGSILGYYHLSRILGGAANVPTAVIRTMDRKMHAPIADRGARWSTGLNQQLWNQVKRLDATSDFAANYMTPDKTQVFGALSDNPSNEVRYAEVNANSSDPAAAKARFLATPAVTRLLNAAAAASFVPRDFAKAAPVLQQMRDMGDLILMDYLFQQQDRFGNIHNKFYWYWLDAEGRLQRRSIKLGSNDEPDRSSKPDPGAVEVKRLLLKDNDCGSRAGHPKAFTAADLGRVRHMHPRTYRGIRYLAQQWSSGEGRRFFEQEALLNTPDVFGNEGIADFGRRIVAASDLLTKNCKAGTLRLDLDIRDHVKGTAAPSCDISLATTEDAPPRPSPAPFVPTPVSIKVTATTIIKKEPVSGGGAAPKCNLQPGDVVVAEVAPADEAGHLVLTRIITPTAERCSNEFWQSEGDFFLFRGHIAMP